MDVRTHKRVTKKNPNPFRDTGISDQLKKKTPGAVGPNLLCSLLFRGPTEKFQCTFHSERKKSRHKQAVLRILPLSPNPFSLLACTPSKIFYELTMGAPNSSTPTTACSSILLRSCRRSPCVAIRVHPLLQHPRGIHEADAVITIKLRRIPQLPRSPAATLEVHHVFFLRFPQFWELKTSAKN